MRVDPRLLIAAALELSTGCATTHAPAMKTCVTDWKDEILYCSDPSGPSTLPMGKAPTMICEPPGDLSAYIKYTRSKE